MADTIRIPATTRSDFGKGYARRIRNNDQIPAVVYGHGAEPQHVIIPGHETMLAVRHSNAVLELDFEGSTQQVDVQDLRAGGVALDVLDHDQLGAAIDV